MKTGEEIKRTKYLSFYVADVKSKTVYVIVSNIKSEDVIAEIEWYGPWRQYCFFPCYGTVWNHQCLADVKEVLDLLNTNHKEKKS